ncbi:MAG TPA: TatD family hydrolase [Rectinemataceae bacterium]
MPRFTDSHAHLSMVAERAGRAELEKALSAYSDAWGERGVSGSSRADGLETVACESPPFILDIGTEPGDLGPRLDLWGRWPFVRFSAGLWPGPAALGNPKIALAALAADLELGRCSALGECGLDYYHMAAGKKEQIALFRAQVEMAAEWGLGLVVHSRNAFEDSLAVVSEAAHSVPVVIHCFGYGPREAEGFLEAGCYLSFAGNLCFPSSESLRRALALTPPDRVLIETDSPYMNPPPFRGKPSTPLDMERTLILAAHVRGEDPEALGRLSSANAQRLFPAR